MVACRFPRGKGATTPDPRPAEAGMSAYTERYMRKADGNALGHEGGGRAHITPSRHHRQGHQKGPLPLRVQVFQPQAASELIPKGSHRKAANREGTAT